jgi:hypothetical protein
MKRTTWGLLLVGSLLASVGCGVEATEEGAPGADDQRVEAQAGCIPGQTRTVKQGCCSPYNELRQNQICTNSSGSWSNSGSAYCAPVSANCYL